MAKSQLTRMHNYYGRDPFHKCKQCVNLVRVENRDKHYYKCLRYGTSSSVASDWALSYVACGAFNKPLGKGEQPLCNVRDKAKNDNEVLDGRLGMDIIKMGE